MDHLNLYMIRCAPVIGQKGMIYGDDVEIDLDTQAGRIKHLAEPLPPPDRADWYFSGVDRTYKTVKAVLKVQSREDFEPVAHEGFREQDFGTLIGKKHADITDHLNFIDGKIYVPAPPDGETIDAFIGRTKEAIEGVKHKTISNDKGNIVVFSHGGTIRAAHAALNGLNADEFIERDTLPLHYYKVQFQGAIFRQFYL